MADFPSMVLVLAGVLFVVRSLSPGRVPDAVMAGLMIGAAGALKPPNLLVVAGVGLAYVVARRWREGLACGAAIVPALLVLLLWKVRGLGEIPVFALGQTQVAAGSVPPVADLKLGRYFDLDLEHWRTQMDQLREFFWSARLVQWAPFAGLVAVFRVRRGAIAALLGGWLAAFILVKGFSIRADIQANTFWRLLMPAWPAYLLLFASIPLLVPTLARRLGERVRPPSNSSVSSRWIVAAVVVTVVIPAVAIAAATPLGPSPAQAVVQDFEAEISSRQSTMAVELRVERTDAGQLLTWTGGGAWRADVFYRVYRYDGPGDDTVCLLSGGVGVVLRPAQRADRDDARPHLRRRVGTSDGHVSHRRGDELGRRSRGRGRVRVQPSGRCGRLSRSSSSAMRCARSTFSSVSLEITVE